MTIRSKAKMKKDISDRTDEIEVGKSYWLSTFHDRDGAYVKVSKKSKKQNSAGWNSTVHVEVTELHTSYPHMEESYAVGTIHTVNATNLYNDRHESSHTHKFRNQDWMETPCGC
jgi:hypothetical protein